MADILDGDEHSRADIGAAFAVSDLGNDEFQAQSPGWFHGDRVFGGMVLAQAVGAANRTVGAGLPMHSLHGYFLRPVGQGQTVNLSVERIRDGRSFTTRGVTSSVEGKAVFKMTCSFHQPEDGDEYQKSMPAVPEPDDVEVFDQPMPFEVRDLGPSPVQADGTYTSSRRVWLRAKSRLPDDPALHTTALAFLSDMTGTSFRPLSLDLWGVHTDASLDHAVWFHRPARVDEWLLYDLDALINTGGRSTVRGLMYTRSGQLCLSMAQELLIRPIENAVPQHFPWSGGDSVDPAVL